MSSFKPDIYRKNIFDISYSTLKNKGIKLLLFDLDNTIIPISEDIVSLKTKELFDKLNKDFKVMIVSNSLNKRVSLIANSLNISYISFARKPLTCSFKKAIKINQVSNEEAVIIGDQLFTDILGGKKVSIKTILVDPLTKKDFKITKINRFLEKICFRKLQKCGFEKGKYYE